MKFTTNGMEGGGGGGCKTTYWQEAVNDSC